MTPQETLDTLRTLTDPTPEQLQKASDLALLSRGWTTQTSELALRRGYKVPDWISPDGENVYSHRPHPCASIDDAVRWMVPEGWWFEVSGPYQDGEWCARLKLGEVWHKKLRTEGFASSPALALTIAGLAATKGEA